MRGAAALAVVAVLACACVPKTNGLPTDALDEVVARAIGDPATCLLVAERATRRVVYRYGDGASCARALPACDRPGALTPGEALSLAEAGRTTSCASNPDKTRAVAWAEGRVTGSKRDLIYSAVMEGDHILPGMEISARLDEAFRKAGL
jgi:hypothetical protein